MTIKEFANCLTGYIRQSIVPTLPMGVPRGVATCLCAIVDAKPSMAQDVVDKIPLLTAMGIVKDGVIDVDLTIQAIDGFFVGCAEYKMPLIGGASYTITQDDAAQFCVILKNGRV